MAVDEAGKIVFQGQSGAANLASTPENRLRKNLTHATDGCPPATHVCGCFAGLISDEIRQRGEEHLRTLFPNAAVRAEPDYTAAFYASPDETDICVIAGTGSLVCSREGDRIVKSGGRGYILGDVGSAYQFGRETLIHYMDHREEASATLRSQVLDVFGTEDEAVIVSTIYKAQTPATIVSKFAKSLGSDARVGAVYALESIDRNTAALASIIARHARQNVAGKRQLQITLAGGLWKISNLFKERLTVHLVELLDDREVHVSRIMRPPLHGAVELARKMKEAHGNH
jgi:N-acetylglucosamine kinase-like BadF-type ATPase